MRAEIETLEELDAHINDEGTLRGCALQDLDLTDHAAALETLDVHNALFLGCRLSASVADLLARRGALVFPRLPDVPFDAYRAGLYTPDELYLNLQRGYPSTIDGRVYSWTLRGTVGLLDATLARALHDHSIADALVEAHPDPALGVGIMGGHAIGRGTDAYRRTARLAHQLAASGRLVITGGGPGSMEAANLGASFTGTPEQLDAASDELAAVPSFKPSAEAWAKVAFGVRDRYRCTAPTLGIPTWFYGHEPPNIFATAIAKFFDNAIREDTLLALCGAGVIFTEGAAGTVQEIFQAATRDYYAAELRQLRPLVLVGLDYWTETIPAWPLLATLASGRLMQPHIHLVDTVEDALDALT